MAIDLRLDGVGAAQRVTCAYDAFLRATHPRVSFVLSIVVAALLLSVTAPLHLQMPDPLTALTDIGFVGFAAAFGWKHRSAWLPIVSGSTKTGVNVACGCGAVIAVFTGSFVQGALAGGGTPEPAPPLLYAVVLAPLAETLVFQGWIQTALEKLFGTWWALATTSLLFWAVHLTVSAPLIIAVIALCWIRARTQSLATVAITHAAMNGLMSLLSGLGLTTGER